jgi:hypothetical protein
MPSQFERLLFHFKVPFFFIFAVYRHETTNGPMVCEQRTEINAKVSGNCFVKTSLPVIPPILFDLPKLFLYQNSVCIRCHPM